MNEQELNIENMQENIDDYNRKVAKKRILVTCVAYLLTVLAVGYFIFFKFFNTGFVMDEDNYIGVAYSTAWIIRYPAEIYGEKVKGIDGYYNEMSRTNAKYVYIEDGIEELKSGSMDCGAFEYADIIAVRIPDTISHIGDKSFFNVGSLKKVIWDGASEQSTIGDYAFYGTGITQMDIPDGVDTIGDFAFSSTPLEDIQLPDSLEKVGMGVFYDCNMLTSVDLPQALDIVPDFFFAECEQLREVQMGDNIKAIGHYAFYNTGIKEDSFPENLYFVAYFTDEDMERGRENEDLYGYEATWVIRGSNHFDKFAEYETVRYDRELAIKYYAEKTGIPEEAFKEPVDSNRVWIEGNYYELPLKSADFKVSEEWERIPEECYVGKESKWDEYVNTKTGQILTIWEDLDTGLIDYISVEYDNNNPCFIILPGGIMPGDAKAHYYYMAQAASITQLPISEDKWSFVVGPKDNPIQCEYYFMINEYGESGVQFRMEFQK